MNTRGWVPFVLVAVCLSFVSCDLLWEEPAAPASFSVVKEYLDLPNPPFKYGQPAPDRMIQLGRVLFYDKNLSANNSISCGSCHKQRYAFGDNVPLSKGFNGEVTIRNTMSIMDAPMTGLIKILPGPLFPGGLFWDGRSASLTDAVSQPITNHIEMGMTDMTAVVNKLKKLPYYRELFAMTFGEGLSVTASDIQQSLSFFVLALETGTNRFKQYEQGSVKLTDSELLGKRLFIEKYDCASCHEGQLGANSNVPLTYGTTGTGTMLVGFANIGLPGAEDKGLYEFNRQTQYTGLFKIPNLNNVELTAPYMHDGSLATLDDVLDHYSESIQPHPNLDDRLRNADKSPMRMDISAEERSAIIDFLKTFTDKEMGSAAEFSNPFERRH